MILALVVMLFALAFVTLVIAVSEESVVYSMLSFLFWIVTAAGLMGVEVTGETTPYTYYELAIPCIIIGIIMIIWTIVMFLDFRRDTTTP